MILKSYLKGIYWSWFCAPITGSLPAILRKCMGEKFAEFDQYQLGKHGKKMKKNKIPIDFFGASSKDDSDQGNGSNMREWDRLKSEICLYRGLLPNVSFGSGKNSH